MTKVYLLNLVASQTTGFCKGRRPSLPALLLDLHSTCSFRPPALDVQLQNDQRHTIDSVPTGFRQVRYAVASQLQQRLPTRQFRFQPWHAHVWVCACCCRCESR
jgi:hypothetical protein